MAFAVPLIMTPNSFSLSEYIEDAPFCFGSWFKALSAFRGH
jgi:hypothetical protein